jgi:hypothetical protein
MLKFLKSTAVTCGTRGIFFKDQTQFLGNMAMALAGKLLKEGIIDEFGHQAVNMQTLTCRDTR